MSQRPGTTWHRTLKYGEAIGRSVQTLAMSQVPLMMLMSPGSVRPPDSAASTASLPPQSTAQSARQAELVGDRGQQPADLLVGLHERGSLSSGMPARSRIVAVPGEVVAGRVVEAGDRRRRRIDRPTARHPLDEIGVAVAELRCRRPDLGLLVPEPEDGRQRRAARHGQIAGLGEEPPLSDDPADGRRLGPGTSVEEQDGRRERPSRRRPSA